MADYIDKDRTLKELLDWCAIYGYGGLSTNDIKRIFEENIPTADVRENIKGKWEVVGATSNYERGGFYWCSQCGARYAWGGNFCQNCGADMRGEKDGLY